MKKISIQLTDVDVRLVKFVKKDLYEDFGPLEGREVSDIKSEIDEINAMQAQKPLAFFKQNDGSYIFITMHKDQTVAVDK